MTLTDERDRQLPVDPIVVGDDPDVTPFYFEN